MVTPTDAEEMSDDESTEAVDWGLLVNFLSLGVLGCAMVYRGEGLCGVFKLYWCEKEYRGWVMWVYLN